jgi:hypothetical protein
VALEADSYCSEADVIAETQYLSDFTASTVPTEAQLLVFMASGAGILYQDLREVLGDDAPGPASYSVTVDTTTDAGTALFFVLTHYNATFAAFKALEAAGANETPARTERVAELWAVWQARGDDLRKAAESYRGRSSESATHISTGEITAATVVSREEDGLAFDGRTEW